MELETTRMIARKEGGIGWVVFNQPEKHNAVSYDMWTAVPRIVAAFEADTPDGARGGSLRRHGGRQAFRPAPRSSTLAPRHCCRD